MRELPFGNLVLINLSYTKAGRYEGRITVQTGWHNYPRFSTAPLPPTFLIHSCPHFHPRR